MPPRPAKADFNIHVTLTYSVACECRNSDQGEADERKLFHPHDICGVQENIYASISIR